MFISALLMQSLLATEQFFSRPIAFKLGYASSRQGYARKNPVMTDNTFYLVRLGNLIIGIL